MIKILLYIFLACTLCFACKEETHLQKKIDHKTMVNLLYDLSLTDGIVSTYSDFVQRTYVKESFYKKVFDSNKVTQEQFQWNVIYYTETRELPALYEEAITRLNDQRSALEKARLDSLLPKPISTPTK